MAESDEAENEGRFDQVGHNPDGLVRSFLLHTG